MKSFIILIALICSMTSASAETRTITTSTPLNSANPYYSSYGNSAEYNFARLSEMEGNIFGHTYNRENIISRIERLENAVFNRIYPNSTVDQRVNSLVYNYNRVLSNSTKTPASSKFKSIVNGLNSALFGVPTGYTPPISDPYSVPYYSIGTNGIGQHYGNYSDYYGRNGWHRYGNSVGSGTGIHILD